MRQRKTVALGGGVDGTSPESQKPPGRLRVGINVEAKPGGGYREMLGCTKVDPNAISGEGPIRGVWYYNGKVYAFRNASGGATCTMWESTGSGWTAKKTGLTADGTYEFVNADFGTGTKMYGVSGAHKAFEWDGTTWSDITTGMSTDEPDHIIAHRKHLFMSFGQSVQNSGLGDPFSWSVLTGSTEIRLPHECSGFSVMPNGALGIYTRSGIVLLSGTSSADWVANNLVEYSNNAGAIERTIQPMGSAVRFVDSRGVTDFASSDVSSDFYDSIISHDMDNTFLDRWKNAICSTVVRAKNQYRVFFSGGAGLIFVFNGNTVMPTQIQMPITVRCIVNTEDASGNELIYFGSDDGFIYQMESGASFAGENIDAYAEVAFTDLGYRANVKRFHRMWCDTGSVSTQKLSVKPRFYVDNGGLTGPAGGQPQFELTGTLLGDGILGQMTLGGTPITNGQLYMAGISEYLSLRFYSSSSAGSPWELDSYTIEFTPGRQRR